MNKHTLTFVGKLLFVFVALYGANALLNETKQTIDLTAAKLNDIAPAAGK